MTPFADDDDFLPATRTNAPVPTVLAMARDFLIIVLATALIVSFARGQEVRVANNSGSPFTGWIRTTVDVKPPHQSGKVDGVLYVVGREAGLDLWVVDLLLTNMPSGRKTIELGKSELAKPPTGSLLVPSGWPEFGGVSMDFVSWGMDGAALSAHMRCRPRPMLIADAWMRLYPDQPGLVVAEVTLTASNPTIPDLHVTTDIDMSLTWGKSWSWAIGYPLNEPTIPAGITLCDGQAISVPVTLGWTDRWVKPEHVSQFVVARGLSVSAVGVKDLYAGGNPKLQPNFNAVQWTTQHLNPAAQRLKTWVSPPLGPTANSSQSGAQEDQVWVRGECYDPTAGVGCEQVAYLVGLGTTHRPCHHREKDGGIADPVDHPRVMFWFARPHPHPDNDLLGKPRTIGPSDANGWIGPDREHWLINTPASGYRLTGSNALQYELRQQAMAYLWQETVPSEKPDFTTNGADAARSAFWVGMVVEHLWRNLEDRDLAERVLARCAKRLNEVYFPAWRDRPAGIWDVRLDARLELGPGRSGSMLWQQTTGAYGIWRMAVLTNNPVAQQLALNGAKAAMIAGWRKTNGTWIFWDNVCVPLPTEYVEHDTAHRTGWYDHTWAVPGLIVVLKEDPTNAQANEIWGQLKSRVAPSWMPPDSP